MRHLLLGALLPDAARFTIILVDVLHWPAIPTFTYLIPFHSLLITALLAMAIALFMPARSNFRPERAEESRLKSGLLKWLTGSRWTFGWIMVGAAWHLFLDDVEGLVGCGSTTFYPFYFGKPLSGWDSEGQLATLLLVVSAMALGLALARRREWPPLILRLTWRRLAGATVLVITALILPLFFRGWMVEQNAYSLGFVTHRAAFEGQSVELCFSQVIAADPPTIVEFDRPFILQTPAAFTVGEWVSVRGIYEHGASWPTTLIRYQGFGDVSLSLVGAAVFGVLMFDRQYLNIFKRNGVV